MNRARVEIVGARTGTLDALMAQSLSPVFSLVLVCEVLQPQALPGHGVADPEGLQQPMLS